MVVGTVRSCGKYRGACIPHSNLVLLFLAPSHASDAPDHELGRPHVRRHDRYFGRVLHH
jgi:hypothetical protein